MIRAILARIDGQLDAGSPEVALTAADAATLLAEVSWLEGCGVGRTGQYTTAVDAALRPAETVAETVAGTVDERVNAWEAIAKHTAFLACYDYERPLLVSMLTRLDELTVTESHLSEMLCDLTGRRLSKPTYPVSVMVQEIEDYFERIAETVPTRHETPDVAELRRLLGDMRALATREGVYNGNRAVLDIIARVEPLLDDADALRAELAHMTEARDNARAEVERLSARPTPKETTP